MRGERVTIEIDCRFCGCPLTGSLSGDIVSDVHCGECAARLQAAEDREADLTARRDHHPTARGWR